MHILNKYTQHIKIQQEIEYEERFNKKKGNRGKNSNQSSQALLGTNSGIGGAQVGVASNTYATNYSSNMPPVASGSQVNI